ncbi:unnamed protein product [Sphagnum jensenii]|uniref:Uncharacterized protein n=1 Tax=Sphagnum jensenii TaxID=128206 RepID=A0ABP0VAZ3_9BRYO
MTKDRFLEHQMAIIQIGRILNSLEIEDFISEMENAKENPIVDPVMKLKAETSMKLLITLGKTLLPVRVAFQDVFKTVILSEAGK